MRSKRTRKGGTLALVAVAILIIGLVGVGLFFASRLLGGHRELDYATRSGNLNVAKQAIIKPNVALADLNDESKNNFSEVLDEAAPGKINLRAYNRLVGQALLVALNAKAEGTPEGIANAKNLIEKLQSATGPGGKLREQFIANNSGTLSFFTDLGLSNGSRMLGEGDLAASVYAASYVESRPTDIGATNIKIPADKQLPWNRAANRQEELPTDFITRVNKENYFRGYKEMDIGIGASLIGVPVQPASQPHLVSAADFKAGMGKFGTPGKMVPPNAFEYGATKQDKYTAGDAQTASRALIGVLNVDYQGEKKPDYPVSIPGGYLVIDNGAGVDNTDKPIKEPGVLNDELDPIVGIDVDSNTKHFSAKDGLIEAWQNHNKQPEMSDADNDPDTGTDGKEKNMCESGQCNNPGLNELYTQGGDPESSLSNAHNIKGGNITCTDRNTVGGDRTPANPTCSELFNSGAMDKALTPGSDPKIGVPGSQGKLTAAESAKADVMDKFSSCGYLNMSNGGGDGSGNQTATKTGMRKYRCEPETPCPWKGGGVKGKISDDGTLEDLFKQAQGNVTEVKNFITQRIFEIKPEAKATDADVAAVFTKTIPLGSQMFIYMGADKKIHMDTATPKGRKVPNVTPDGKPEPYVRNFKGQDGDTGYYVNPKKENNIHDQLYRCGEGQVNITNRAVYTPSSGFNNLLGEVKFEESVTTDGAYYCCPD